MRSFGSAVNHHDKTLPIAISGSRPRECTTGRRTVPQEGRRTPPHPDARRHELLRDACPSLSLVALVQRLWHSTRRFDGAADRVMADPVGSLLGTATVIAPLFEGIAPLAPDED